MSELENRNSSPTEAHIQHLKEQVDRTFRGHPLDHDVMGALDALLLRAETGKFDKIKPALTYEESVQAKAAREPAWEGYYNYVMSKSNPEKVVEYNARVEKFNAELKLITPRPEEPEEKINSEVIQTFLATTVPNFVEEMRKFLEIKEDPPQEWKRDAEE